MSRTTLILAAAGGSVLLLAGAFAFQALGYLPCAMCWWQRYPHMAAILFGLLALAIPGPVFPILGSIAAATTAGLGAYHTGVERDWWQGPSSCTSSGGIDGLSGSDLLSVEGTRAVLCDQVSWALWGISMPSWNAILSVVLLVLWVLAARRSASGRVTRPA